MTYSTGKTTGLLVWARPGLTSLAVSVLLCSSGASAQFIREPGRDPGRQTEPFQGRRGVELVRESRHDTSPRLESIQPRPADFHTRSIRLRRVGRETGTFTLLDDP